jgi:hypothetical protein
VLLIVSLLLLNLIQEDQFTYKDLHPGTITLTNIFRRGDFNGKEFLWPAIRGNFWKEALE